MIADPRVFDDDNDDIELLNRDGELAAVLERFDDPTRDDDVLLSGPSGVGKSLFAQTVLDELERERPIDRVHVNCLGKTTAGILRAILEAHHAGPDDVPQTRATDRVRDDLERAIDRKTVVVLDEGDDLPYTDAVGELLAMPNVAVIAIVHDETDWLSKLDVDNGHPFDRGHIRLDRYRVDELAEILDRRARQGFYRPEIVSYEQLRALADEVAGVARNGIQRLWGAATVAQERRHRTIRETDIEDGAERARRRIRRLNLESLPVHHRVLYAIVHEAGECSGEALHDRYDEVKAAVYRGEPAQPIGKRARREKVSKLEEYDLVAAEGTTQDRTYSVVDPAVEPEAVSLPASTSTSPSNTGR